MKRVLALVTLQAMAFGSLTGCAPPAAGTVDSGSGAGSGGPTFIQMPVTQQALVGATPQLLDAEFGQPTLLRVDGTAQVWLYHAPDCGLNLILYPDNAGTPRVTMAAPTSDGGDTAACSATLQRAHAQSAALVTPAGGGGAGEDAAAQPAIVPAAIEIAAPPAALPPAAVAPPPASPPPPASTDGAATDGLERASSS